MKNKIFLLPILILSLVGCSPDEPVVDEPTLIYFDTTLAQDGDGTIESPYNTLDKIPTLGIKENTYLYVKKGSVIETPLTFRNLKGSLGKEIVVTSYGEGNKPKISADALQSKAVVTIDSCAYFTFDGFEITDPNTAEGDRRGILITSSPNHLAHYDNITISNNYIHDICGINDVAGRGMSQAAKMTGGIHFWSENGNGVYSNLTITGNTITRVDSAGISSRRAPSGSGVDALSPYDTSAFDRYAFKNVKITNNTISYIGKNAIFVRNIKGGSIDHNTVFETSIKAHAGNSIVTSRVDNMVIEYNEGYYNRADTSDGKVYQDGCMIDPDLQTKSVIVQYNYSHDNSFGLFLNCNAEKRDEPGIQDQAIVRFNLSVNDYGNKGIIYVNYYTGSLDIYNNTIITGKNSGVIFQSNENRTYNFRGNIIYDNSETSSFMVGESSVSYMSTNLYFNSKGVTPSLYNDFTKRNENGVYENPDFVNPLIGENIEDRTGMDKIQIARVNASSIVFTKGVQETGIFKDIFGNQYKKCIGCDCGA